MSALVADTSVWVEFFRGRSLPALEQALERGFVVLPPIVGAELLSSPIAGRKRDQLADMLRELPLHPTPFEHWAEVGALRARMRRSGLSVSTPDAHIAQCTLDCAGLLWTRDAIFSKVAKRCNLRLFEG